MQNPPGDPVGLLNYTRTKESQCQCGSNATPVDLSRHTSENPPPI